MFDQIKKMFFLLALPLTLFALHANAEEMEFVDDPEERIYIEAENVFIDDNAIFVNFNGNFFSVPSIASDTNGIYFKDSPHADFIFVCKKCGRAYNPGSYSPYCPHPWLNNPKCK